jgi:hypothetical protein
MAYIGNTADQQAFTPAIDYFNGNGSTTAFTLSRPVASVAQVQATIENVPQNPGDAFTVSGNTITFTSAPPSGTNNIYVYYTSPITQVVALPQSPQVFGNLQFSSPGARITGDFSNATVANRVAFQTSTTNGNTVINAIPNGTSLISTFQANNNADPTNAGYFRILSSSTDSRLESGVAGTGTYLPLTMYTGGSERLRIATNGRVSIGMTGGGGDLNVSGASTTGGLRLHTGAGATLVTDFYASGSETVLNTVTAGPLTFGTNNTARLLIRADGSLRQSGDTGAGAWAELGNGNANSTYPATGSLGCAIAWNFTGGGRENAFMNCDVDGGGFRWLQRTGTSTNNYVGAAGRFGAWFQGNNSSTWSTTSDIRVKDNIRPISNALEKINSLNPCHFEYKDKLGKTKTGFIAQEFGEIFPGHIVEETHVPEQYREFIPEGESLKGIDADLMPYLVKAIQEQQAIITDLKARIEVLENK